MDFSKLFKPITPEDITDSVFTLVDKVLSVVTAGNGENYNSMVASGGGMGTQFRKPATWCVFSKKRYTLQLIKEGHAYTLSYFQDRYRKQFMFLGTKSGRDSNKMREVELTAIQTPLGNISFGEARLIIECKLTQITTINAIDDFYSQDTKDYLSKVYNDPSEFREYVFGEITGVWEKIKN
ncbi:MAG: hypothetical protein LBB18_04435 [Puniceicoccales bacterium]|jgi:flavin reductase (DIM6/NTAB) family NADH-FMN oxidoreductase RutF|nr:hypothetical protein [Puniceicoccales bacterium]